MMREQIVKCTNCGKISPRHHILPLCESCFIGLEDYEDFLAKTAQNVEIGIIKQPVRVDNFLQL
jgi:hypothetical protein